MKIFIFKTIHCKAPWAKDMTLYKSIIIIIIIIITIIIIIIITIITIIIIIIIIIIIFSLAFLGNLI